MTKSEFEKIKGAIECMYTANISNMGGLHVNQQNVIYILSKFVETEESVEPQSEACCMGMGICHRNRRRKGREVSPNPNIEDYEEEPMTG